MSIDQLALLAKSIRQEERYHRCAMDPDPAQLWVAGKLLQAAGRTGRATNIAATPQSNSGTTFAAYPAHAESALADEYPTLASGD